MVEEINEKLKGIKRSFRSVMNGVASHSMREKGVGYKLNWGVSLVHLREMADNYGKDYDLAIALWKEDIRDLNDQPVINAVTGVAEQYERTINYIQVPIMAHLAWGRENRGVNFFVNAGPQFGVYLSESTKSNFDWDKRNMADRANSICAQDTMAVENKFDYGIAAGAGIEFANPKVGRFLLEGRYYYGLGNIYGDSKRDYFGSSNFGTITIKLTYLFDITR